MTNLTHNVIELQFSTEKARDAFEKKLPIAEDSSLDIGTPEQRLLNVSIAKPHPGLQGSAIHGDTNLFMRFMRVSNIIKCFQELAGSKLQSITIYSEEPPYGGVQGSASMRFVWKAGTDFIKVSELTNYFIEGMHYYDHIAFANSTPEAVMRKAVDDAFDDPNAARIEYHVL